MTDYKPPKISFCTTCKGRLNHLQKTVVHNLEANRGYPNFEYVLLDYASRDGMAGWVKNTFPTEIESGRVVYAYFPRGDKFHMTHAKNMAHRIASGNILVNVDADNFTPEGFAKYLAHKFTKKGNNIYMGVENLDKDTKGGCGGRIAVTRGAFFLVGGYDEKFSGWSPDDKDFDRRLSSAGLIKHSIDDFFLKRIEHSDTERLKNLASSDQTFTDYKHQDVIAANTGKTLVNAGEIGCGEVYINFSETKTQLKPVPSRVFGIGWHKTATTSLAKAFEILGLKALHWSPTLHRSLIYGERDLREVKDNYMLCDFPVPLVYPLLDEMNPGSKFILTTREGDSWLKSIVSHMGLEAESIRRMHKRKKDTPDFPGGHAAHLCAYGTTRLDEGLFLRRFNAHNNEVREYFSERPDDLLTIDISKPEDDKERWQRIIDFLGMRIPLPQEAYPKSFSTEKRIENTKKRDT